MKSTIRQLVREEIAKSQSSKLKVGAKFGEWNLTYYDPVKYDDFGAPYGGQVRLTNQNNFDKIEIFNDLALRSPKWGVSLYGRRVVESKLKDAIIRVLKIYYDNN